MWLDVILDNGGRWWRDTTCIGVWQLCSSDCQELWYSFVVLSMSAIVRLDKRLEVTTQQSLHGHHPVLSISSSPCPWTCANHRPGHWAATWGTCTSRAPSGWSCGGKHGLADNGLGLLAIHVVAHDLACNHNTESKKRWPKDPGAAGKRVLCRCSRAITVKVAEGCVRSRVSGMFRCKVIKAAAARLTHCILL